MYSTPKHTKNTKGKARLSKYYILRDLRVLRGEYFITFATVLGRWCSDIFMNFEVKVLNTLYIICESIFGTFDLGRF
jgi:hypothetical protein